MGVHVNTQVFSYLIILGCTDGFAKIEKLNKMHTCNCNHIYAYNGVPSLEDCKEKARQEGGNAFNWRPLNNRCSIKRCSNNQLTYKYNTPNGGTFDIYTKIYEC